MMKSQRSILFLAIACVVASFTLRACSSGQNTEGEESPAAPKQEAKSAADQPQEMMDGAARELDVATLSYPGESHLRNIRMLTDGGDNAEAYFSFDGGSLTYQHSVRGGDPACDQIYFAEIPAEGMLEPTMLSSGKGRTTCAYYMPGDQNIIYASTESGGDDCPPEPDRSMGYVWPLYDTYEIYMTRTNGEVTVKLTENDVYDAEATVSPKGDRVVFTSTRNGDIDLYTMSLIGTDIKQVTHELGYDGGAFFSPDGTQLVFRASRPKGEEAEAYKSLLKQGLVRPSDMEIFVCNVDGSNLRQVTNLGGANWAPYFHPDGKRILFCSNHKTGGRQFNLFIINVDGTGLKQITFDKEFDSFPMFSPDGRKLVWASNRNNSKERDTNIFIADWVE